MTTRSLAITIKDSLALEEPAIRAMVWFYAKPETRVHGVMEIDIKN